MAGFSRKYRALLVEESAPAARLLTTLLHQCGVKSVITSASNEDAMKMLQHSEIDVVLCDWSGEASGGMKLLQTIRDPHGFLDARLPVIMMASDASIAKVTRARDAGATEFVAKPASARSLTRALWSALENGRPFVEADHYFGPDRRRKRVSVHNPRRASDLAGED